MYAKWIPALETELEEAGEWNGSSLGISRGNIQYNLNTLMKLFYLVMD